LELTESSLVKDAERAIETLDALRGLGVRIAVDDFGTGYSSLSYLIDLPIDTLKIDRSFVRDATTHPRRAALLKGIVTLAHDLRLSVTAEGVETAEQRNMLCRLGCDEIQGYLFSRPVPADEFEALLRLEQ
jgi:EAL domain-containing protein (putative c-di-GMP-specific phosphodiesterase class I)